MIIIIFLVSALIFIGLAAHWHRHYLYVSDALKSQIGIIDTPAFFALLSQTNRFHDLFKQQVPSYLDMYKNWKCWSYRSLTGTYERDIRRLSKFIIGQLVLTIQNQ